VPKRLVLWDVDHTLLNAGGLSSHLYGVVFRRIFGRELQAVAPMAGRTDRAIILDTLTRAGVPEPNNHLCAFAAELARQAPEFGRRVGERGRVLPGAAEALRELAARSNHRENSDRSFVVVQSVLTGNLRPLAEVKLSALGLARYLDLDVGAYGDVHEVRAKLVPVARAKAAAAYGVAFPGEATVIVGDTPYDVEAAVATGARAVGVASGATPARELAAAGADAVLADLADTAAVVAAILD
jgi:phosphoglycolate phosphatase